ncbi:PilT protein domain protein [Halalkaliarchaeum desulfuricum]|uniref:PilT protein domain protein n=1 Tax=Halalkaliarchaeum desulfuricum TaxID=2055893 RepID=A0A343TK87_9EURY|nr:type II toxin-antitoxin system VapC family toxin [Halalkaliarchaeum desulfuricum]AUX09509.1 PilT protein domain protein [Halalkaliarchaeum desulfuricum]
MSDGSAPVFDTSSLVAVLLDDDTPGLPVLFDGHVLDLTFYEAGNVLWKVHALQDRTSPEEHAEFVSLIPDLRREMVVHDLDEIGFEAVMDVATRTELTFYDAAYVVCAEDLETTLVTEDRELCEVDSTTVSTTRLRDLS